MLINNRVVWEDDATLRDISTEMNSLFASDAVTFPFVAADDKLYIGGDFPFNHRYFKLNAVNDVASVISVHIWDGSEWVPAVDVIDQTKLSGVCFAQNGIVSWVTDRNESWSREETTENMTGSGLETLKIYNMYWVRLSFSVSLKATTALSYIGHKFSTDAELAGYYPDLGRSNTKTSFESGKTDWDAQTVLAAEEIIRDLRKKELILSGHQIFGWEEFADASCHKTAEIIYRAFGSSYDEKREQARADYDEALDKVQFKSIDKDADGSVELNEKRAPMGRLIRS